MTESILLNNRYRLEEELGSGGMSVVYRAHDLMLERNVAVKLLREHLSSDPDFRERFRQEAKAAANLSHPNIVTVHDFGYDSERLYIVMEYVPGTDLKIILQRRRRLSKGEAVSLMVQACAGVGYAHRAGLIHCDIKPHNFLITPDRRVKVTDFGISRLLASISPEERSEIVWGSPQYFSPEQATGLPPSPASDVYSLGIILYEMLTGQLPFSAGSAEDFAQMHRDTPPIPPSHYLLDIEPALEQILIKVLAKEPSSRYRSADQFGRVLVNFNRATRMEDGLQYGLTAGENPSNQVQSDQPAHVPQPTPGPIRIAPPQTPAANDTQPTPALKTGSSENRLNIDWISIVLGLLALIAVGGLIPLYIYVFYLFF